MPRALAELFDAVGKKNNLSGVIAVRHSTVPLLGVGQHPLEKTLHWNNSILKYIEEENIQNVILVSKWASYIECQANARTDKLITDDTSQRINPESAREAFKRGQERTINALSGLGVRVWIIKQVPQLSFNPRLETVRAELFRKNFPNGVSLAHYYKMQINVNAIINTIASKYSGIRTLDPAKFCFNKQGFSKVWSKDGLPLLRR